MIDIGITIFSLIKGHYSPPMGHDILDNNNFEILDNNGKEIEDNG